MSWLVLLFCTLIAVWPNTEYTLVPGLKVNKLTLGSSLEIPLKKQKTKQKKESIFFKNICLYKVSDAVTQSKYFYLKTRCKFNHYSA